MNFQFRPLFQVLFPHGYYRSKFADDIGFKPSEATVRRLSGQNYLFRAIPGGFLVLARIHEGNESQLSAVSISKDVSLVVYLSIESETFSKVTQIPTENGVALYASNLAGKRIGKTTTGDWELLPYRPTQWTYDIEKAVKDAGFGYAAQGEALDSGGGILVNGWSVTRPTGELVMKSDEKQVLRQLDLNFGDLPEGCYSLQLLVDAGQSLPEFRFLYSAQMDWQPTLAMFEWFPLPRAGGGRDLVPLDQSYEVGFESVTSFWRYVLVPQKLTSTSGWRVTSENVNGVQARWGNGVSTETPDGRAAVTFTSDQKIPLEQSPTGMVVFQEDARVSDVPLPFAGSGYVTEDALRKSRVYSDIYVYL